jgi:hypothetical protein
MRAAKRQLDACGHQPLATRITEPDSGQFIRFAVDVSTSLILSYRANLFFKKGV